MILSLDIRDYARVQQMFRRYRRTFYGLAMPYSEGATYSGTLAQGENLFITGHGSPESIGHPDGAPRFTPAGLGEWLEESVLPCNYAGEIYLAVPGATHCFVDELVSALGHRFQERVHGLFNCAYSQILPPGHGEWVTGEYRGGDVVGLVEMNSGRVSAA